MAFLNTASPDGLGGLCVPGLEGLEVDRRDVDVALIAEVIGDRVGDARKPEVRAAGAWVQRGFSCSLLLLNFRKFVCKTFRDYFIADWNIR